MLKKLLIPLCLALVVIVFPWQSTTSVAASCSAETTKGNQYNAPAISILCTTTSGGAQGTDSSTSGSAGSTGCYKSDGSEVACWVQDYWWSPAFDLYCQVASISSDSPSWDRHRDSSGNPAGTLYRCLVNIYDMTKSTIKWANDTPQTPAVPGTDPKTLVERAVVSLGLHPPEAGVGAYVYPGYEDWGLTWWVGAPMWLWTDSGDDLQWGTHNLNAADGGLSATATVTSTSLTFNPGNGDTPVTCDTAGTPRPWNPDAPLAQHSPSGCEYTYMTTNTLGDKDSRFVVSATVTWTVTWSSSDGQYGTFTTTTTSTDNPGIHIGELRTVLVPPR